MTKDRFKKQKVKKIINAVQAIMFQKNKFLLLHRASNWVGWEFCKGAIEEGESKEQALAREINEETGIADFEVLEKLDSTYQIISSKGFLVTMHVYLVKVEGKEDYHVQVDNMEHDGFAWVRIKEAMEMVRENEKKVLEKVQKEKSHYFK